MAKIKQPYQCDNCGQLREKDTNCWWLLMVQREKDRADGRRFFHGSAWEENAAAVEGIRHACGQKCALELFGRWLETGSLDPPSSKPLSSTGKEGLHD